MRNRKNKYKKRKVIKQFLNQIVICVTSLINRMPWLRNSCRACAREFHFRRVDATEARDPPRVLPAHLR